MPAEEYIKVLELILQLTPEEQLQLAEELERIIEHRNAEEPLHDVMEFKGVAKELWKDVDVQKYIDEERNSWGGIDEVRKL